jgi:Holliday junction resolvasome RuvABC ATP-dependent DNA helicase subunit
MSVALECRPKQRGVRKRGAVLLETTAAINAPSMPARQKPNILITGTPGTGKTTHSELIAAEAGLQHVNIGALVREHELYDGYNEEFEAYFVNDDKV